MDGIDLHLHLLPDTDDGAPDIDTALTHAARMVAQGIGEAAVTPHVGNPSFPVAIDTIADRTAALQGALDREGIALRLHAGGEIHPAGAADLSARDLDRIAHGPVGARWVLAEVPFAGIDASFLDGLRAIAMRGYGLVIGHPERTADILDGGLARLRPALAAGAVLQVNVCSLLGLHGAVAQEAARRLVRTRMAYIIGSDGHPGSPRRGHTLMDGAEPARAAGASPAQIHQLLWANPRFLLRHGMPPAAPIDRPSATRRRMDRARAELRLRPLR